MKGFTGGPIDPKKGIKTEGVAIIGVRNIWQYHHVVIVLLVRPPMIQQMTSQMP